MARKKSKTGIEDLDRDLEMLFRLAKSGQFQSIKDALEDTTLSPNKIKDLVPEGFVRLTAVFTTPVLFGLVKTDCREDGRATLDEARSLFDKHFPDIGRHPSIPALVSEYFKKKKVIDLKEEKDSVSAMLDSLNVISQLEHFTSWRVTENEILPAVRVVFSNRRNRLLLDTLMDWDDLMFIVQGLTTILRDDLRKGQQFARKRKPKIVVPESEKNRIAERISETILKLEEISELALSFGIEVGRARASVD